MSSRIPRSRFLAYAAALQAAMTPLPGAAQSGTPPAIPAKLRRALVLSGGGALGAYAAGILESIVKKSGAVEGQPLPDYGVICGTSIGALNAYLAATAQYGKLRNIWASVSKENVVRLKPEFAKITSQSSGVTNRVAQAIGLAFGAFKDVQGVLDGAYLEQWLEQYLDLSRPIVTPLVWATTNLSNEAPEFFYLLPKDFGPVKTELALSSIRLSLSGRIPVREADRSILVKQLRASAAVPIAFDPVVFPDVHGKPAQYVDGGVTANTPIGIARAISSAVDAVLLAPAFDGMHYANAIDITAGSFETMQRVMMADALRSAYLETYILRAVKADPHVFAAEIARSRGLTARELDIFANLLVDTTFFVLRPERELPVKLFGFDDSEGVAKTYAIGVADGAKGFQPFDYSSIV